MSVFDPISTQSADLSLSGGAEAAPRSGDRPHGDCFELGGGFEALRSPNAQGGTARLAFSLTVIMALTDLAAIAFGFGAAMVLADWLRMALGVAQIEGAAFLAARGGELALMGVLAIGVFAFGGLYRRGGWELSEIRQIFTGMALVALFDAALMFLIREHDSRLWFVLAYPMAAASVAGARMALRSLPKMREAVTTYVVIIGGAAAQEQVAHELRRSRSGPVRVLPSLSFSELRDLRAEDLMTTLRRLADRAGAPADKLLPVLAPTMAEMEDAQTALERLNAARQPYSVILPFRGLARHGLALQNMLGADMVLAEMHPVGDRQSVTVVKRIFDVVATTVLIFVLAIPMALIALCLLAERGPVFFAQRRVGRGGRRFTCLKFRTMAPDAEDRLRRLLEEDPAARSEWTAFQKLRNDPRVTRVGAFLRRSSLDELPQLFNVLRGEMSLVGPRPIIAPEVEGYPSDRAYFESPEFEYYRRCSPGITGLWQVSGRASTTHEERVRLDRWYYRNWSFWLDIVVLFRTVGAVLGRRGSH